jgi:uncharacterized membrane protein YiaA
MMRKSKTTLSALILGVLVFSVHLWAEEIPVVDQETARQRLAEQIEKNRQADASAQPGNLPQSHGPLAPAGVKLNEANQSRQQEAISEYFTHIMESNRHQRRVFRWQLLSSKIIFVTVVVLVAAGIYFAAVQFHHGLRRGSDQAGHTEIEASLKGIKVSSPILGVIILTLSLAFFYLYLVYVYPIEFVK